MLHLRWYNIILPILLLLPGQTMARDKQSSAAVENNREGVVEVAEEESSHKGRIFSGFSGGMMLHLGYGFSQNPSELFRNETLQKENLKNLPKDGVFLGIGGQLRFHLFDHLRLGSEGYVSNMPLKQVGQIRTGWGGVLVDGYTTWGKIKPFIGLGVGGGAMRRIYVNESIAAGNTEDPNDSTIYNASFTRSPFFYLDPQLGLEFGLTKRINMVIRLDYMLPFSAKGEGIRDRFADMGEQMRDWKGLMTPTGPRLYVGFMFNH